MSDVTVDSSRVDRLLANLENENRQKIITEALRRGGQVAQQSVKQSLRAKVGSSAQSMEKGIKLKVDKAYSEVTLHIMGDYRLKWFEKGTKPRYTKGHKTTGYLSNHRLKRTGKGGYRGQMVATHFFKEGLNEQAISTAISDYMDKSLTALEK